MTRTALALAALLTLSLNGSMAWASMPGCPATAGVCEISLRMMTAPPARPANLAQRYAQQAALIVPVSGRI